jgi:eukaryotic-like serine/threonine-protein kinase
MKAAHDAASADTAPPAAYAFGPFRLDIRKRRVWKGDHLVALTPKAFDTLLALVGQAGQIVDKDDLLHAVWPGTFVTDETLTQNIATIRRALGDSSESPEYIATIPRRGYQFIAVVTQEGTARAIPIAVPGVPKLGTPRPPTRSFRSPLVVRVGLVAVIVSVGVALVYSVRQRPEMPASNSRIQPPPGMTLVTGGVLSPDGESIAYVAIDEWGTTDLWVEKLGSAEPTRLAGTQKARNPFWSPDSKEIAFAVDNTLKRIVVGHTAPQLLAHIHSLGDRGGAWNSGGTILYSPMEQGPLCELTLGSHPIFKPVTRLEPGERVHLWPNFLPDGRHFLYRAVAFDPRRSGTYVGSLDAPERRTPLDGVTSAAVYAEPGYLLFVRDNTLLAQRFDARRQQLEGEPTLVAAHVAPPSVGQGMTFSASGPNISFLAGGAANQLAWFDRHGARLATLESSSGWIHPALSLDDEVVAAAPLEVGTEIWIAPKNSVTPLRLDTGLPQGGLAVWSRDGRQIAFTSAGNLYSIAARGGERRLIVAEPNNQQPLRLQDWSADGQFLLYYMPDSNTNADLGWFSTTDRKSTLFLSSSANELQGQLSPDGHWIVYASDETGQYEVYADRFPEKGFKTKISTSGGAQPQWRHDGKEVFYLSLKNELMSVEVGHGARPSFPGARKLFHIMLNSKLTDHRNDYAVSRDGKRFLISTPSPNPPPIIVRANWTAAPHR